MPVRVISKFMCTGIYIHVHTDVVDVIIMVNFISARGKQEMSGTKSLQKRHVKIMEAL